MTALEFDSSALNSTFSAIGLHTPKLVGLDMAIESKRLKIKIFQNETKRRIVRDKPVPLKNRSIINIFCAFTLCVFRP